MPEERARRLRTIMEREFPEAEVTGYEHLIAAMKNHEKDRHVAAAALPASAQLREVGALHSVIFTLSLVSMVHEDDRCLDRRHYDAFALLGAHPPRFHHEHKRKIYELARRPPAAGTIRYSRWAPSPLPALLPPQGPGLSVQPSPFDYVGDDAATWHVNFADPNLFVAYGSSLLAQDELQVLEHPALGSLRESLLAERLPAVTEEDLRPTPVLVTGVERLCELDTSPTIDRPRGIYGRRFSAAPFEVVASALRTLDPPTRTNLIAMAAPVGSGTYRLAQVERIVITAYTAFSAAVRESHEVWPGHPVEVRTGFWGCGAFGGNRTVMVLLQLLAARLAGVHRMVFYTVDTSGLPDVENGVTALRGLEKANRSGSVAPLLELVTAGAFPWGTSDGN